MEGAAPQSVGSVQQAVRHALREGDRLLTPTGRGEFEIGRLGSESLVLLLGEKRAWTPLRWECLEGIVDFMNGRGWIPIGGRYETAATPDTFDSYLKKCINRATAGWVAVVLERAGILEIDRRRPARVRLSAHRTSSQR
jgi:hypothetical protein